MVTCPSLVRSPELARAGVPRPPPRVPPPHQLMRTAQLIDQLIATLHHPDRSCSTGTGTRIPIGHHNPYTILFFVLTVLHITLFQGCGTGSELDPDSVTLWIRIRIGNPDPGSGSRGKKVKKFRWKNPLFSI
jgi:hypothetical protein